MMYHFAITEPFNLNWKYAAPKDFDTLEYHLKPGLSIELSGIANGPNKFSIGAYLADGNHREKFNNEILPARSSERVEKAFQKEEVSCFFSAGDAKDLKELFDKEKFICRSVTVKSEEHGDDFFALPTDEYNLVLDFFSEVGVQQVADIKESRVLFEGLHSSARKEARDEMRREQRSKITGRSKVTEKKMKINAAIGGTLLGIAGVLKIGSRQLMKKGFFGIIGGIIMGVIAAALSLTGVRLLTGAGDFFAEGML